MPRILPIIKLPHEHLRLQSRPLTPEEIVTPEFQALCDDMIHTMYHDDGIGLAAPQTDRQIRLITIGKDALSHQDELPFPKNKDLVLINPNIETYSWKTELDEEACLSVTGLAGTVERHVTVSVTALLRDGSPVTFSAKKYLARVLQHEIDHLNGVLFIDRAKEVWKTTRQHAQDL